MKRQIWKYAIPVNDRQVIDIPEGYRILHVDLQHGVPCIWASVDPTASKVVRTVFTVGTGHPFDPTGLRYLGSYQLASGHFVGHVLISEPDEAS